MRAVLGLSTLLLAIGCGGDEPVVRPVATPPLGEPPAHAVGGFTITMPSVELTPGLETEPCWIFPIAIEGPSRIVGGAVLRTPPGMHHGNITTRRKTGEGIRPCERGNGNAGTDIIGGGSVLFASSTQVVGEEWYRFPDGHGFRINDQFELVARMHYVNPSDQTVQIAPSYEWFTIDETRLVHELGPFAWIYQDFEIPPLTDYTVTADCDLPGTHPMHVTTVLPHMHQLGRAMTAGYVGGAFDGELFLDSAGYDPDGVLLQYEPPVDLTDAAGITFSCRWQNTFDKTIVEGVGDNEMCVLFGYAWPVERAYSAVASPGNCLMLATPPPS